MTNETANAAREAFERIIDTLIASGRNFDHSFENIQTVRTDLQRLEKAEKLAEVLRACKQFGVVDATNSFSFEKIIDEALAEWEAK